MKTDITAISENIVEFFEKTTLRDHIKKHGYTMRTASLLTSNIKG